MPGENIQSWSTVAASNSNADTSINWAEGMPRASVNNSARSMMAAHAKERNLLNGTIVTGGSVNAQTFTSGVGYTAPIPVGLRVLLKIGPSLTNTGPATLDMDGIGAVAIINRNGTALIANDLIGNTYAEFIYSGLNWVLMRDVVNSISGNLAVSGDVTCTNFGASGNASCGDLTCSNIGAVGNISGVVFNCTTLTAVGNISGAGINCGTLAATGNITSGANIVATANMGCVTINCSNGGVKPGGGLWFDSSDARIKNVVGDYGSGLAAVKQLRPVRYSFKGNDDDHQADGVEFVGLVAQEIEQIFPEMVTRRKGHIDGVKVDDLRMVDANALIYALVNSVKELSQRIEALEAR